VSATRKKVQNKGKTKQKSAAGKENQINDVIGIKSRSFTNGGTAKMKRPVKKVKNDKN
jgi:hypothetical protein